MMSKKLIVRYISPGRRAVIPRNERESPKHLGVKDNRFFPGRQSKYRRLRGQRELEERPLAMTAQKWSTSRQFVGALILLLRVELRGTSRKNAGPKTDRRRVDPMQPCGLRVAHSSASIFLSARIFFSVSLKSLEQTATQNRTTNRVAAAPDPYARWLPSQVTQELLELPRRRFANCRAALRRAKLFSAEFSQR